MHKLPTLGIVAAGSNVGKTTVITQLIPALRKQGIRTSVIKHAHHQFDIDHPGKDSYKIRAAGAAQTLIASGKRWALMTETLDNQASLDLNTLLSQLDPTSADLILIEGFKQMSIPKIEIHRPSLNLPLLAQTDKSIIAIATDAPVDSATQQIALNKPEVLCQFIIEWIATQHD